MTDQIPADKVRAMAARFRQQIEPHIPFAEYVVWERAAEAVESLLSPPPRPTLADMTPRERRACNRMLCDVKGVEARAVIVNSYEEDGKARVAWPGGFNKPTDWEEVTPRRDLSRMKWPGEEEPDTFDAVPPNTLAEGSVWDDGDALEAACAGSWRDQIVIADKDGDVFVWSFDAEWWECGNPTPEFAPWTILHAGKEADQ